MDVLQLWDTVMDAEGKIANPATAEFLVKFLGAFETWIRRF